MKNPQYGKPDLINLIKDSIHAEPVCGTGSGASGATCIAGIGFASCGTGNTADPNCAATGIGALGICTPTGTGNTGCGGGSIGS